MSTSHPGPHIDPAFATARLSYDVDGIDVGDLAAAPLEQFRRWYDDAVAAAETEPNAMTLATADASGLPSARTVLLKTADAEGFVFFSNYESRKGSELAANPRAAIAMVWIRLHRQVCVRGPVERVPAETTAEYFGSRPWGSRIGAWASHQSQEIATRAELEARWSELAARWPDHDRPDDVPVPPHWGGYVLHPIEVEFWQGRTSRLHDRLVYLPVAAATPRLDEPAAWRVIRREP
jgi:pyridoxamine 5'-phosphate oxidase